MKKDCFGGPGQWYKGNLHSHTTNSDGHLTPAQAVAEILRCRGTQFDPDIADAFVAVQRAGKLSPHPGTQISEQEACAT